jgi:hypothetical protein
MPSTRGGDSSAAFDVMERLNASGLVDGLDRMEQVAPATTGLTRRLVRRAGAIAAGADTAPDRAEEARAPARAGARQERGVG